MVRARAGLDPVPEQNRPRHTMIDSRMFRRLTSRNLKGLRPLPLFILNSSTRGPKQWGRGVERPKPRWALIMISFGLGMFVGGSDSYRTRYRGHAMPRRTTERGTNALASTRTNALTQRRTGPGGAQNRTYQQRRQRVAARRTVSPGAGGADPRADLHLLRPPV